jgi:hypothetical protein
MVALPHMHHGVFAQNVPLEITTQSASFVHV